MKGFLNYVPGNSFFHRLNPLSKLILAFIICMCSFISNSILFIIALILLNVLISKISGVFDRGIVLFFNLAKFSVFIFILQVLFIRQGNALIILPFNLSITDYGVFMAFTIALRLLGATMPLAIMLSVTKINDLSNILVTKLNIPYKYAFTLTTAMRFIPVFADEMSGIMEAQASRGVELDTKNFFKKMRLILPLCVPLLITSVKKIESSAISAEIRGFHLRTKDSCYKKYSFKTVDTFIILFSFLLIISAFLINFIIK